MEPLIKVRKEPLVQNLPPLVMDVSKATPRMQQMNEYLISSELPPACKILYDAAHNAYNWKDMDSSYEQGITEYSLKDLIR